VIEFWKDDLRRRCRKCGKKVANPRLDLGCAEWCQYADRCLEAVAGGEAERLCDVLVAEMERVFGEDERRVAHALEVLDDAERILEGEKEGGAAALVVKAAAILHDIGIREAERKHGSVAGKYQEIEGPPIAREILERVGVEREAAEHILKIVGSHHSARDIDTPEFRIVWDADRLANWQEECGGKSAEEQRQHVERVFRTATGRRMGREKCGTRNPELGTNG
jgi:hypothetical protein